VSIYQKLRLILGDQLNEQHPWFREKSEDTLYVFLEMRQETDYVAHHIQKVVAFFGAMRSFAGTLRTAGHQVEYWDLEHPENQHTLHDNIIYLVEKYQIQHFAYQLPDEYRLDQQLQALCKALSIESEAVDSAHFLGSRQELGEFFAGKKMYLMENFYRMMRRKWNILMEGTEPVGGQWNFDTENRKKLPSNHRPEEPLFFEKEVSNIAQLIQKQNITTIGQIEEKRFIWPINRTESLTLLRFFCQECLPHFGTYQDAMSTQSWSLYHARLSFSLNTKMLSPLEVVEAAVAAWQAQPERISLPQIEGFVRQIIGWREYMRGIYWLKMPNFAQLNFFNHQRALPDFYWTARTHMNCMRHAIGQSLQWAYAHHIQRLMVTGNFALLAGIHPDALDAWYLGIYIDAIEWVEITNTRGMSQYADGGIVGSKPYVSSANYIDKMSNYCPTCFYDKNKKTGLKACPFNSLYWHFYHRHRTLLERNPRIGMMYRTWDKMSEEQQTALLHQAEIYLQNIENI
jgi:deoxyribodipyrimidine photolyase-related protein